MIFFEFQLLAANTLTDLAQTHLTKDENWIFSLYSVNELGRILNTLTNEDVKKMNTEHFEDIRTNQTQIF